MQDSPPYLGGTNTFYLSLPYGDHNNIFQIINVYRKNAYLGLSFWRPEPPSSVVLSLIEIGLLAEDIAAHCVSRKEKRKALGTHPPQRHKDVRPPTSPYNLNISSPPM